MKGDYNQECNRTACQNNEATFYNHSTKKYYCTDCATLINRVNPESQQMFGHPLCTKPLTINSLLYNAIVIYQVNVGDFVLDFKSKRHGTITETHSDIACIEYPEGDIQVAIPISKIRKLQVIPQHITHT